MINTNMLYPIENEVYICKNNNRICFFCVYIYWLNINYCYIIALLLSSNTRLCEDLLWEV